MLYNIQFDIFARLPARHCSPEANSGEAGSRAKYEAIAPTPLL